MLSSFFRCLIVTFIEKNILEYLEVLFLHSVKNETSIIIMVSLASCLSIF